MIRSAFRATLFTLYQFTIAVGILLMPLAVAVRQLGVPMPLHRVVETVEAAYERTGTEVAT